ncbi:pentapeptide repeat-containing protein [Aerosakkonemataceae cyanobacterium BLCC-F50]|uniref:Pentapeptide repeat-containing protein n=1 Tax=Floridaenema flaviceps BLCC-F50 TaxID=3153642 RepID=A0ABV4XK45_9CYAN
MINTEKRYLQNPAIRQLLITKQGENKNFDRQDLRDVNLQGAKLADASFTNADLSNANLQDADLSRAKLVQTQLDKTDFTGATLTGAYIEDWGITRGTKFDGVRCEYVFMRLPTKYNPDPFRKPDNNKEVFADGEFGDFIKPIVDTLDLYHNQDVDPRAIAIAFKQLAENHPDAELEIVAIEKRGAGNISLRAATSPGANRSELSSEYSAKYNEIKALNQELKARLAEKDSRIISLQNMLETALQRPSFYAENYHNQGDTMSDNRGDIYAQSGNFGIGHMSGGTIEGGAKVAGVINEAEQRNLAETAAEIQQLLEQLDKSYSTDTTAGKMAITTEAIKQIESNPTLLARIMSALKAGGVAALDSALDHPAASFVIAALQDLHETGKAEH